LARSGIGRRRGADGAQRFSIRPKLNSRYAAGTYTEHVTFTVGGEYVVITLKLTVEQGAEQPWAGPWAKLLRALKLLNTTGSAIATAALAILLALGWLYFWSGGLQNLANPLIYVGWALGIAVYLQQRARAR